MHINQHHPLGWNQRQQVPGIPSIPKVYQHPHQDRCKSIAKKRGTSECSQNRTRKEGEPRAAEPDERSRSLAVARSLSQDMDLSLTASEALVGKHGEEVLNRHQRRKLESFETSWTLFENMGS